jgi:hypothetical protein
MPAYFNQRVYFGAWGDSILAFDFTSARLLSSPSSKTTNTFGYPGATPSVSANGTNNGIVWAAENTDPAVLHAYDANDLSRELYNSSQAGSRDLPGRATSSSRRPLPTAKFMWGLPMGSLYSDC